MVQKETKTNYYSGKVVAGGDNLLAGRVYLTTENLIELRGSITPRQVITGDVLLHIPDYDFDTYRGPLELTPTASGFDVSTKGKIMPDDMKINPIPFSEVSNTEDGLTITIA